ncbi:transcription factor E2F7 [Rhinophrynus dorsalis]
MELTNCLTLKDLISTKKHILDHVTDEKNEQKENIFDRFRISPRVPLKTEPIDLSKQKSCTPERIPVTPVKVFERPQADPWTPTANLKMLISVASPEIRDREKKKELFRPIENDEPEEVSPDSQQFDTVDEIHELEKRPSRKQKSLGLLCQKFLARYPSYPMSTEKMAISLDEAASSLGVERRRIYDIVNVLESLQLVSRVAKNQYCWHGQHNLKETLRSLQRLGEKQKYGAHIAHYQHTDLGVEYKSGDQKRGCPVDQQNCPLLELSEADCPSASTSSRKDKSLRIMSQKFVMLFLVSTTKIITLEIAAKILIEESQDAADYSKFKTKVRRLYDIANVLTSLGLIKKVHVTEERGRKPAFKWIGPIDFRADNDQRMEVTTTTPSPDSKRHSNVPSHATDNSKQRLFHHSSFNKVHSSDTLKRKVFSQPSSPHDNTQNGFLESMDPYSSKMAHLAEICSQNIEDNKCQNPAHKDANVGNLGSLPFSLIVPVDPEYSVKTVSHHGPAGSQKNVNGQLTTVPSSQSDVAYNHRGLLSNQPYMYIPSTSVFMLCGNLAEKSSGQMAVHTHLESCSESPTSNQRTAPEDEQPTKRHRTGVKDPPLSLCPREAAKKSPQHSVCESTILPKSHSSYGLEDKKMETVSKHNELGDITGINGALKSCEHVSHEHLKPAQFSQYLYVPSPAGFNGFNFLLPSNQTAGSVGLNPSPVASLNIPYVMVPSTALTALPFICSSATSNLLPSTSSGSPSSPAGMNFSLPGKTSATHLLIGPSPAVPTTLSELSPDLPQPSIACVSPVPERYSSSESKECPVDRSEKSPTPLTPTSIRPVHQDNFFKTPGSLGISSYLRKSELTQIRNSSSAQRRLDICSSASD